MMSTAEGIRQSWTWEEPQSSELSTTPVNQDGYPSVARTFMLRWPGLGETHCTDLCPEAWAEQPSAAWTNLIDGTGYVF